MPFFLLSGFPGASTASSPFVGTSAIAPGLFVEVELDGVGHGWTNLKTDVLRDVGIHCRLGIGGNGPTDRVAVPGTVTFGLNNSEQNSARTLGYYSPFHADRRPGWALGIRCRVRLQHPATGDITTMFVGKIDRITPVPWVKGRRTVEVVAADFMNDLARWTITSDVGEQLGKRFDEVLAAIVDQMPNQPEARDFDAGADTFPYALDTSSGQQSALTEAGKLAASELGYIFVHKDGTLRAENRHFRPLTRGATLTSPIPDPLAWVPGSWGFDKWADDAWEGMTS
jgi:hypothetical protein